MIIIIMIIFSKPSTIIMIVNYLLFNCIIERIPIKNLYIYI